MKSIFIYLLFFIYIGYTLAIDCTFPYEIVPSVSCSISYLRINRSYYDFVTLETTPPVVPLIDSENQTVSFYLEYGQSYQINYEVKMCNDPKSQEITISGFKYTFPSQPKCFYTQTLVTFYDYASPLTYQGSNFESIRNFGPGLNTVYDNSSCQVTFFLTPVTNSTPSFTIVNPTCGYNNGTLYVPNTNDYSTISLYDSSENRIFSHFGLFSSLSPGSYTLVLASEACGTEVVPLTISNIIPQLLIDYVQVKDLNLPVSQLKFSFSDSEFNSSKVTISYNDIEVSDWNNFSTARLFAGSTNKFVFSYDNGTCSSTQYYYTAQVYPNVYWTQQKPSDGKCSSNVTVSLQTEQTPIPPTNINYANKQFQAPYGKTYSLSTNQSQASLSIPVFTDIPIFQITRGSLKGPCTSTFDVKILNIDKFSNISIVAQSRDGPFYPKLVGDTFVNVTIVYNIGIGYIPKGCSESNLSYRSIFPDITDWGLDSTFIEYTTITPATCINPEETFNYTVTNAAGVFGPFQATTSQLKYSKYVSLPDTYCFAILDYTAKVVSSFELDLDVVSNMPCSNEGNSGVFNITIPSNYTIQEVTVDGQAVNPLLENTYPFYNTNSSIQVKWKYVNGRYCYSTKNIQTQASLVKLEYTTVPVTNCSQYDGEIHITNYNDFSSIQLNGGSPQNGVYTGLSSFYQLLNFETASGCVGTQRIYVPTISDSVSVFTTVIQNPTCSNSKYADGSIQFSVNIENNTTPLSVQLVDDLDTNTVYYNIYPRANPGTSLFWVGLGSCSFIKNVTVDLEDPSIGLNSIFNSTSCLYSSVSQVTSSNDHVLIQNVVSGSASVFGNLNGQWNLYNNGKDTVEYTVSWNDVCQKKINSSMTKFTQTNPVVYTVKKVSDCKNFYLQVQIENFGMFASEKFYLNYQGLRPDANGFFSYVPSTTLLSFYYTTKAGCSGTHSVSILLEDTEAPTFEVTNDICYSGQGQIKITNYNSNYYYTYKQGSNSDGYYSLTNAFNVDTSGGLVGSNSYIINRYCKNNVLCNTINFYYAVVNNSNTPSIKAIDFTEDTGASDAKISVTLNYQPQSVTYQINDQTPQPTGEFNNLPAGDYKVTVVISDKVCATTLTQSVTIAQTAVSSSPFLSTSIQTYLLPLLFLLLIILN
ncbi:hypothetical protein DLAC_06139 [Tieghemostelium lacteum]|uniref:Uncharacterized protein n=1 Tax=Tieghemostelium lacteum TaxID=361077 RepID=A0A151ZHQ9_TIELA|nr:hypothetical protein DLAC_06139 [Tieghemostelium lacteum]|eukprot:KYQ93447.1 hypothetical protein DLAC_06139 [Tieghemostelium lacteum]